MITAVNALPIHSNNSKNISKNIAFGNNEQQKTNTNNQNTDFYKTNTGLKTGIGYAIVGQCTNGKGFFDVLLSDPNHVPNNSSFPLDIVAPPMFDYYYLTPYNHQNDEGMGISYA